MKKIPALQLTIFSAILVLAASCSSGRRVVYRTSPPPSDDRRVVVVRQDTPPPGHLPPGQAKKIYGGKSARAYAPGQQKKYRSYPLIIVRTPGIVIRTHSDGRHYFQNSDGIRYWRGNDDRFYLDDAYVGKSRYNDNDYKAWKSKGNKGNSAYSGSQGNDSDKGKGNGNGNSGKNGKGKKNG